MNPLRRKILFVAAAGVTTWILTESPMAQTSGADAAKSSMEQAAGQLGVSPKPSTSQHDDDADAAMTGAPNSSPTDADQKASDAMSK